MSMYVYSLCSPYILQSIQYLQPPQPIQYSCYIDQQRRLRRGNISQKSFVRYFSCWSLQSLQSIQSIQSPQSIQSIHCIQSIQVNLAHLRVDFRAFFSLPHLNPHDPTWLQLARIKPFEQSNLKVGLDGINMGYILDHYYH